MGKAARHHDLDALRAFAMLLGVFWHAALFILFLERAAWPTDSRVVHASLSVFVQSTHSFRLPLFFLIAGFFAALVIDRADERVFLRARLKRIGLPLVVGYVTVVPLTQAVLAGMRGDPLREGLVLGNLGAVWFLWYLLLFYAAAILVRRAVPARAKAGVDAAFGRLLGSRLRLLPLALLSFLLLLEMPKWGASTSAKWAPEWEPFVYYGLYFGFGWLLHSHRDRLAEMGRAYRLNLALMVGAACLSHEGAGHSLGGVHGPEEWRLITLAAIAVVAWTAIFGFFGLFQRLFAQPRPAVRYLADSSYWIYLAHGPLVIAFDAALLPIGLPLWAVVMLSGTAACAVLLVVYEWFIRYGAIGRVLHGPRTRPEPAPAMRSPAPLA